MSDDHYWYIFIVGVAFPMFDPVSVLSEYVTNRFSSDGGNTFVIVDGNTFVIVVGVASCRGDVSI